MPTIHIRRLRARYRLSGPVAGARRRLDGILASALSDAIDNALARDPLDSREECCIRHIHVPVTLRLDAADTALAASWGDAVAGAVRAARRQTANPNLPPSGDHPIEVVRYASREHALLDLIQHAIRGDLRRAWAWRQLDLWRGADLVSEAEALREVVRTLVREPGSIVPILHHLATRGGLPHLAARLENTHWISLAAAALEFSRVDLDWRDLASLPGPQGDARSSPGDADAASRRNLPSSPGRFGDSGDKPSAPDVAMGSETTAWDRHASRVIQASRMRAACPAQTITSTAERAFAALMILEVEPGWSAQPREAWRALIDTLVRRSMRGPDVLEPPVPSTRPEPPQSAAEPPPALQSDARDAGPAQTQPGLDTTSAEVPKRGPDLPSAGESRSTPEDAESASALPADPRRRGFTRAGGLLFFLNLLPVVGIPERVDRECPGSSLHWVLHRLGRRLVSHLPWEPPLEDDDPALLAFAGRPPGSAVPPDDHAGADSHALEGLLVGLEGDLRREVQTRWPGSAPEDASILGTICVRDAEVVADPGWFEVHLALRDVRTELRRMGLDRDPGFIPWLGVVMKFIYE